MLSDPMSMTYDSTAISLPVASARTRPDFQLVDRRSYRTASGEFEVYTSSFAKDNDIRVELFARRVIPDSNTDPFDGINSLGLANGFGIVLELNKFRYNSSVDIPKLRTMVDSFVDSTLLGKLIGGQL